MKSIIATILYTILAQVATYAQPPILETILGAGESGNVFNEDALKLRFTGTGGMPKYQPYRAEASGAFYFYFQDSILCKVENGKVRKLITTRLKKMY